MFSIVAICLAMHFFPIDAGDPCPPKTVLAPCTCSYLSVENSEPPESEILTTTPLSTTTSQLRPKRGITISTPASTTLNETYTIVDCKVSKTLSALEETISTALDRKLVDKLVVGNIPPCKEYALARLPSGWLRNVRVRQFEVLNSKLSGDFIWYGNPFEGQAQSLLWFAVKKCFLCGSLTFDSIGTVNTKGLNSLPRIEGVDFSQNFLTAVMASAFRYPPANLSTVVLSHNSISYIEAGSFQHIYLLKSIDLSRNLLENVARSFFAAPARRLEQIDLSWNYLSLLPHDFFMNMPALKTVNLAHNFLYSMPEKPWLHIWRQLTYIDVTGNFVECNCDLMWLLPILSPPEVNATTTPPPTTLPGQTVAGVCTKTVQPQLFAMKYELAALTRDRLAC